MALDQDTLDAISAAVGAAVARAITPARGKSRATKAKARVKAVDPRSAEEIAAGVTLNAKKRELGIGGACEQHDKRFATAAGYAWHMENVAHE